VEVRFVDCRNRDLYLVEHLPGAAHADPERDLTGRREPETQRGGRHPLPAGGEFAAWASAAGIGSETLVVGYDEGSGWAARLWWLLRHFGHDLAGVIPFAAWQGPLGEGAETIETREFLARPRSDDLATPEELLERLDDPRLLLLDARAPARFRGEVEPIDAVAGRIPGARNLFFQEVSELPEKLLRAEEIVVYCGSGVTACVDLLALARAGRPDARLYPGSWSEWSNLGLPLERG